MSNYVVDALNDCYNYIHLSHEQSRGIITHIPKPAKDSTLLKSHCLISFLNMDYKIGATATAVRLKLVVGNTVGPNQTGFLHGRFIGANIRFVLTTEIVTIMLFADVKT